MPRLSHRSTSKKPDVWLIQLRGAAGPVGGNRHAQIGQHVFGINAVDGMAAGTVHQYAVAMGSEQKNAEQVPGQMTALAGIG